MEILTLVGNKVDSGTSPARVAATRLRSVACRKLILSGGGRGGKCGEIILS